jgi:hypothetical protein
VESDRVSPPIENVKVWGKQFWLGAVDEHLGYGLLLWLVS